MFVAFCLSVCCCCLPVLYVVLAYEYVCCFLFISMFVCCCLPVLYVVVLAYECVFCFCLPVYLLFLLAYEYVCCLFCLPVNVFCYFCLPVNFAITERESHHVMVVSENETWIWTGHIVTMPLPSGF